MRLPSFDKCSHCINIKYPCLLFVLIPNRIVLSQKVFFYKTSLELFFVSSLLKSWNSSRLVKIDAEQNEPSKEGQKISNLLRKFVVFPIVSFFWRNICQENGKKENGGNIFCFLCASAIYSKQEFYKIKNHHTAAFRKLSGKHINTFPSSDRENTFLISYATFVNMFLHLRLRLKTPHRFIFQNFKVLS